MMDVYARSNIVKSIAARLGFDDCGIARTHFLEDDARRLESWLSNGFQGKMSYMANHFDLRVDPQKLVPGAKSVITLLVNYYPQEIQKTESPKISKYAFGKDYHLVIRNMLNGFLAELRSVFGEIQGRGFVDSAPVLERAWAKESGLGWVGKNGNLLQKGRGSFFFIASIISDLQLEPDQPFVTDHCGTCRKCIEACPTDAILENKVIDGSRCISYYTIELKDALIDENMQGRFENWMFGCDTCQDVCPWNRFAAPHHNSGLKPIPEILDYDKKDWEELTEEKFRLVFKDSPLKRTKFEGIKRNLKFIDE